MDMEERYLPKWIAKGWSVIPKSEFDAALTRMRERELDILTERKEEELE